MLGIAGCAATTIAPTGGDMYYASRENVGGLFGNVDVVAGKLMVKAGEFCAAKGRDFVLVTHDTSPNVPFAHMGGASITFRCVIHVQEPATRPDKAATIVN
jgi:hypothetical protein